VAPRLRDEISDLQDRLRSAEERVRVAEVRLKRQGRVIVFCLVAIVLLMVLVLVPGLVEVLRLLIFGVAVLAAIVMVIFGTITGLEWLNSTEARRRGPKP
jgi:uncharacterized membrane protein